MPGILPGQTMLACITRIYRHFTYMLLAHVMQSALTGSLLRSGTALVDSRQRPSIDRRAQKGAAAREKRHFTLDQASKSAVRCISALHSPRHAPLWPLARLFTQSENPFCDRRQEKLPLAFCRERATRPPPESSPFRVKEGLLTLQPLRQRSLPPSRLCFVL
jgi:hypothetical protein